MRKRIITNALAYNKYLTIEFLESKSDEQLLAWTHPLDRVDFQMEMRKNQ